MRLQKLKTLESLVHEKCTALGTIFFNTSKVHLRKNQYQFILI